jgi:hypothetical protein
MDYLDGNLSDQEIQMLENFLLINTDLRAELEGTEKIALSPHNIYFKNKEFLLKPDLTLPVTENNFEDFCIAQSEGDLNLHQESALAEYTEEHPESLKLKMLFAQLHLMPDNRIVFSGKSKLKKAITIFPKEILYPALSFAAAVAFMLFIYLRNEDIRKDIPGIAAELPVVIKQNSQKSTLDFKEKESKDQNIRPTIQEASILPFSTPKEKKQNQPVKSIDPQEKIKNENKNNNTLPPQRLNPSIQIKLPSLADNQIFVPTIDRWKITYSPEPLAHNSAEYLSLSEYARKQFNEKLLGNKDIENTRISAWQIADAGINGINKLTGGKMKLEKRISDDGTITAYSFNSKLLSFSTTSSK